MNSIFIIFLNNIFFGFSGQNLPRPRWNNWSNTPTSASDSSIAASPSSIQQPFERITPLLDYESLASILFLIFPHEYRIYNTRLQRIIRNLCVHVPTRDWIIRSLISVLQKCHSNNYSTAKRYGTHRPVWLGIKVDPSINSTANMFNYEENYIPGQVYNEIPITIHPQSITPICCEVLDHLIPIAKIYPLSFLPLKRKQFPNIVESTNSNLTNEKFEMPNIWDILIQIDNTSFKRKQEGTNPFVPSTSSKKCKLNDDHITYNSFEETPFGKLIPMLKYCKNKYVTGKLLRLLSLISTGLSFEDKNKSTLESKSQIFIIDKDLLPSNEIQLKIIVHTLTESTGTADGLEEFLILNLCKYYLKTRAVLYKLLIESLKTLAMKVEKNIVNLINELTQYSQDHMKSESSVGLSFSTQNMKGALQDRFTNESVIVNSFTGNSLPKSGDVQLSSMGPLTSKQSNQAKFLRVLKVVIKIRECVTHLQSASTVDVSSEEIDYLTPLSDILKLNVLWETLSDCLVHLEKNADHYAVLVLQPAVEAFFLVHASSQMKRAPYLPVSTTRNLTNNTEDSTGILPNENEHLQPLSPIVSTEETSASLDQKKFLHFAEKHRTVLNQILRQSSTHLADGPFSCLVDHARILDFDVKRRFFRTELERLDEGVRREELAVHVHRITVFEDSFRELYRRSHEEWKNRFYIVFEGTK